MKKILLFILGILLIGCAQFGISEPHQLNIKSIYDGDQKMWDHIFAQSNDLHFTSTPRGAILPHHMIVCPQITEFYKALAQKIDPSVVVILSPNHYQNGESDIQTCQTCVYQTINGPLAVDKTLSDKIIADGMAHPYDETFIKEHGIYNHAPFIKKFFPKAQVLPIVLKWQTTPEETLQLSQWLQANLPSDAFVIASVDFSHYIPVEAANFHDVASYATIKNFDFTNVFDLEIDSPPSISTIMHLMEAKGAEQVSRLIHTNNQDFHEGRIDSTTSHQFIAFYDGKKQSEKTLTVLAVGNIDPPSSKNGFYDSYRWNIHEDLSIDPSALGMKKYLRDIKGIEDRFLVGADFVVFDMAGENNQCATSKQNEIAIAFCNFHEGSAADQLDQIGLIKKQKKIGADVVYVSYRFKNPELTTADKKIAHNFMNIGATIFIGKGIHLTQPIENDGTHLLAYSLGDFITASPAKNSSGIILGIVLRAQNSKITITTTEFPIAITDAYPKRIPQLLPKDYAIHTLD